MNKYEAIEKLEDYERQMRIDELSERTIRKYLCDVRQDQEQFILEQQSWSAINVGIHFMYNTQMM